MVAPDQVISLDLEESDLLYRIRKPSRRGVLTRGASSALSVGRTPRDVPLPTVQAGIGLHPGNVTVCLDKEQISKSRQDIAIPL